MVVTTHFVLIAQVFCFSVLSTGDKSPQSMSDKSLQHIYTSTCHYSSWSFTIRLARLCLLLLKLSWNDLELANELAGRCKKMQCMAKVLTLQALQISPGRTVAMVRTSPLLFLSLLLFFFVVRLFLFAFFFVLHFLFLCLSVSVCVWVCLCPCVSVCARFSVRLVWRRAVHGCSMSLPCWARVTNGHIFVTISTF